MNRLIRAGKIKLFSVGIFVLIIMACQPATREAVSGPPAPAAGAGMLWYDGSILVYSPEQNAWVSYLSNLFGITDPQVGVILSNDPEQNITLTTDYCVGVGASGIVSSAPGFLCEFKDPVLYPPLCEIKDTEAGFYIGSHELSHAPLNFLDEYVEPGIGASPSDFSIHSSFCSSGVGGVSFEVSGAVKTPGAYRVTTDGEDMECAVVDGRLACTGGKSNSAAEITICSSAGAGSDPADEESNTCPSGYLKNSDGICKYSPIDRASRSPGGAPGATDTPTPIAMLHAVIPSATATTPACERINYAYDPKAGNCKPLDEAFPCEKEGEVRMLYGRCEPRCSNGFTPDYKGSCLPCNAGLSSNGGLCYVCPEGMISAQGGVCVSYDDFYKTMAAPKLATEQASVEATKTAVKSSWLTEYPKSETRVAETNEAMIQTFRAPWTQAAQTEAALLESATPTPGCPKGTSSVPGGPCLTWDSMNATSEAAVIQTATAFKAAFLTEQAYTPTPGGSGGCGAGTMRDSTGACVPCPSDTIFDPVRWACVPVAAMWISSCPAGYYFDEKTGTCLAPSGHDSSSCFGSLLNDDEFAACYPAGCLAGSTLDTGSQCCQASPPSQDHADTCITFTVQMPSCETRRPGGGGCSQWGPNDCALHGCTWDPQYNSCK